LPADYLDVGRVVRPHGLRGQVVVELWTNREERLAIGSTLTAGGREMRISSSQRLPDGHGPGRWLVTIAGVDGRQAAEELRGTVLQAPPLQVDDALWVHEMIGSQVQDAEGTVLGVVESVEANPSSDLLVLEDGRLIPLTFVVSSRPGWLTVSLPPGLLEL
jgi:16S rRNA processing protein RimM